MFCPKCGDKVEQDEKYCNKCGNCLINEKSNNLNVFNSQQQKNNHNNHNNHNNSFNNKINSNYQNTNNNQNNSNYSQKLNINNNSNQNYQTNNNKNQTNPISQNDKKMIFMGMGIGLGGLLIIFLVTFIIGNISNNFYFSKKNYNDPEVIEKEQPKKPVSKSKYSTVIITDNTYTGVKISKKNDAYELISEDSVSQKSNCPSEIKEIENQIIKEYGITAVNLCEMNLDFARETGKVFKKIYEEYPSVRGYLTNLTLINTTMSDNYIAAFMPMFNFAKSDSETTYPWVIKTQVLLNTTYFLNPTRLESTVVDSSKNGHFPPNATIYSPVAHELGHYLSFLAMMKNHNLESILLIDDKNIDTFYKIYSDFADGDFSLLMIEEAYNNYKKENDTNLTIDEWRATISKYAVTKDNSGEYIYDETIAEAFHDVYLNEDNAKPASKYVTQVLRSKLEG